MRHLLQRIIVHGESIVRKAERGDEDALNWCGFLNLTLISAVVIIGVLIVWIWI
jgi:hypothetical protein